jgi:hypothetical protein
MHLYHPFHGILLILYFGNAYACMHACLGTNIIIPFTRKGGEKLKRARFISALA